MHACCLMNSWPYTGVKPAKESLDNLLSGLLKRVDKRIMRGNNDSCVPRKRGRATDGRRRE